MEQKLMLLVYVLLVAGMWSWNQTQTHSVDFTAPMCIGVNVFV